MSDAPLASCLGQAARLSVDERYSEHAVTGQYAELFRSVHAAVVPPANRVA